MHKIIQELKIDKYRRKFSDDFMFLYVYMFTICIYTRIYTFHGFDKAIVHDNEIVCYF
jgi:hypothetical protein